MTQLSYTSRGSGEPILFVHGWGVHSGVWERQMEYLSAGFRTIAVDLPGHGRSEPTGERLTVRTASKALVETLKGFSFESVHLVGWSLGAQVACMAAADPDLSGIASITIVGGTPCFVSPTDEESWALPPAKAKWFRRGLEKDYRGALENFILGYFGEENGKGEEIKKVFMAKPFPPEEKSALEILDDFLTLDIRDILGELNIPCLICHGESDTIVPVEVLNVWKNHLPSSSEVIFENCGHVPFFSHSARFNESLKSFISGRKQ